jgi:hypothetical protein
MADTRSSCSACSAVSPVLAWGNLVSSGVATVSR